MNTGVVGIAVGLVIVLVCVWIVDKLEENKNRLN